MDIYKPHSAFFGNNKIRAITDIIITEKTENYPIGKFVYVRIEIRCINGSNMPMLRRIGGVSRMRLIFKQMRKGSGEIRRLITVNYPKNRRELPPCFISYDRGERDAHSPSIDRLTFDLTYKKIRESHEISHRHRLCLSPDPARRYHHRRRHRQSDMAAR